MSASEAYRIHEHRDPRTVVMSRLKDNRLSVKISGKLYLCDLVLLEEGSFNRVYAVSTAPRIPNGTDPYVVIRIAKVDETSAQKRKDTHEKELATGLRLAEEGICPRIFMNLQVILEDERQLVTFGTAIERYDCSLADVQSCPILMKLVFVEGNGESLLVDLYARASATKWCVDTKPGNVVVRLPKGGQEPRSGLSLALIDVDPFFCNEKGANKYIQTQGQSPLRDLDSALCNLGKDTNLSESALLVAAMSLLVHVTVSALEYTYYERGFGFPYIEITLVLMRNWNKICIMLRNDTRREQGRYINDNTAVHRVIVSRWKHARYKGHFDLTDTDQLYMFLASVVVCRESRILRACTKERRPDLYRNIIALTLGYTREQYRSKLVAVQMSESIEAWEAIMKREVTEALSPTQCGITKCTVHHNGQHFGRNRRAQKRKRQKLNEKKSKKKTIRGPKRRIS